MTEDPRDDYAATALEDLDRLEPETWVEVHGERLCARLRSKEDVVEYLSQKMLVASEILEANKLFFQQVLGVLNGFPEKASWDPKRKGRVQPTRRRWDAAVEMYFMATAAARICAKTVVDLNERSKAIPRPGEAEPSGQSGSAAEATPEALREQAKRLDAATKKILDRLPEGRSKDRVRKAFKQLEDLSEHPVMKGEMGLDEYLEEVEAAKGEKTH